MTTSNSELAAVAKDYAAKSDGLARRAWLCVGVALSTTSSLPAAGKALEAIELRDVKAAAVELLGQLASDHDTKMH